MDISADCVQFHRKLTVLDTGAGPNFIRRSELPAGSDPLIRPAANTSLCDANGRPLDIIGTVSLSAMLGSRVTKVNFYVCKRLAAAMILGCDFNDRYVEAILPKRKVIELDDGSTVPIVRKPPTRPPCAPPLPHAQKYTPEQGRASTKVKVAKLVTIEPLTQTWVTVQSGHSGLSVLQPSPKLLESCQVSLCNGVVEIIPNVPFKVLVSNFATSARTLQKDQVVGHVLPHPMSTTFTSVPLD